AYSSRYVDHRDLHSFPTRRSSDLVMELAKGKYEIEERIVEESELRTADEIFITSSFKDIVPIVKIDDFEVGDGKVGPITQGLMRSEEHTSELQSRENLVCRLLLEK